MKKDPGIYPNVPYSEYAAWDARRSSTLKHAIESAHHMQIAELSGSDEDSTRATELGSAAHEIILRPEIFRAEYCKAPEGIDKRTKAGKEEWAKFQADNLGKSILPASDYDDAIRMRDSAYSKSWASALLGGPGLVELSIVWDDPETGIRCKARMDRVATSYQSPTWEHPATTIAELKTDRRLGREGFKQSVGEYSYHLQAFMQIEGMRVLTGQRPQLVWPVFEKKAPFEVALYEPDDEMLEEGELRFRHALALYRDCKRDKHWPGFPEQPQLIGLKPWHRMSPKGDDNDF